MYKAARRALALFYVPCEFVHSPFLDARFSSVTLSGYVEYYHSFCPFAFHVCLSEQEVIPPIDIRNRSPDTHDSCYGAECLCGLPTSEVIPRRNLLNPIAEKAYVGDLASMDDVLYTRSEVQFANCMRPSYHSSRKSKPSTRKSGQQKIR
jgi:hypothetical protein